MFSKRTFAILAISLFTISLGGFAKAASIIPQGFLFQQNIKMGATLVPDVSYLQNFLNQNSITRVADTGPGSDGELTNYFGQKTLDAVMRFQNLYSSEILIPAGITVPTGFFGENTRKKINALLATQGGGAPQPVAQNTSITTVEASSTDPSTIDTSNYPLIAAVVPNGTNNPNDTISIYGYGFTNANNTIMSSLGIITGLTSSNNTITFKLSDFVSFDSLDNSMNPGDANTILIKIRNSNGISIETGAIIYQKKTSSTDVFDYTEDIVSTTTVDEDGATTTESGTSVNSLGLVTQAATYDAGLQGSIQAIKLVSSVDPLAAQMSKIDPIYSMFGGSSSGGGALGGALGGAAGGALGGGGGGGGAGGTSGGGGMSNVNNGGGNFSGNITYCTCSGGELIQQADVRGGTRNIFYRYGASRNNEDYNVYTNVNQNYIEGLTKETVQCQVYNGESCTTEGTADWVIDFPRGIGTSLTGSGVGM
ncbi:MAG: peptidoglycan-binding domain-containing protein [Patescibacteria group bacterium]